ncbi:MAG: aspartate carbamoyltransferase catalytic subunit [Proteobacteria bacterium]|nr:aspartate carbamoyltransferase catalytic subunit [Pseudomonadota bacterium]NCA27955.1 aspartate carbamoyltransferase catalytic subunit [Pseudomonadota bacterium]
MKDLISIDQLKIDQIEKIFDLANLYFNNPHQQHHDLDGKLLINFFFENSTRTRMSFEIAGKKMGAKVVNLDISLSSLKKGESIIDTTQTINAMQPDFVAIRHNSSGIVELLKKYINCSLINAGDGTNEHPSQALLDCFIIKKHKHHLQNLKIAICGDVLHSRVARSNIKLLSKYGCKINIITPATLVPHDFREWLKINWNIEVFNELGKGLNNADVVMLLRIQQERMSGSFIPSPQEYFKLYGLSHEKLKVTNNALVMHPGPINRGVEISSKLADDLEKSVILKQVSAGVAIRQALLKFLTD